MESYKVLVIDDDEMIATATSEYFNMFGVKTSYVTSYVDAVAFLENMMFHCSCLILILAKHLVSNSAKRFGKTMTCRSFSSVLGQATMMC